MKKQTNKLYKITKLVLAQNVKHAIRMEKSIDVHEIWIDEDWKKGQNEQLPSAIGFDIQKHDD